MNKLKGYFSKHKNTCLLSFLLLIFFFTASIPEMSAYLTDSDALKSTYESYGNSIRLVEDYEPPDKLSPGISFRKEVKVENQSKCPCFVRVKAVFADSHMEEYCQIDWNDSAWTYDAGDGYWYYPDVIEEGESTPELFSTVAIAENVMESELAGFEMVIYAESVESNLGQESIGYRKAWEIYHRNRE